MSVPEADFGLLVSVSDRRAVFLEQRGKPVIGCHVERCGFPERLEVSMWAGQHRHLLVLLVLSSSWCCPAAPAAAALDPRSHLRRLFDALDKDHDGQLRQQELKQYIGGLAPEYSSSKLDKAVEGAIGRLDSPDQGLGVDWTELEQHLHTILQVGSVAGLQEFARGPGKAVDAVQHLACDVLTWLSVFGRPGLPLLQSWS